MDIFLRRIIDIFYVCQECKGARIWLWAVSLAGLAYAQSSTNQVLQPANERPQAWHFLFLQKMFQNHCTIGQQLYLNAFS